MGDGWWPLLASTVDGQREMSSDHFGNDMMRNFFVNSQGHDEYIHDEHYSAHSGSSYFRTCGGTVKKHK